MVYLKMQQFINNYLVGIDEFLAMLWYLVDACTKTFCFRSLFHKKTHFYQIALRWTSFSVGYHLSFSPKKPVLVC